MIWISSMILSTFRINVARVVANEVEQMDWTKMPSEIYMKVTQKNLEELLLIDRYDS